MSGIDFETFAPALAAGDFKSLEPLMLQLEKYLTLRTYLDGYDISDTDRKVWTSLRSNKVAMGSVRKGAFASVARWFNYLETTYPELKEEAPGAKKANKGGANYNIGLPNTENGVVTRFPPEPSYVLSTPNIIEVLFLTLLVVIFTSVTLRLPSSTTTSPTLPLTAR